MIERKIFSKLKKLYLKPDILALIGARRVGKTTLMKQLFDLEKEQKEFISFDDQIILNLFEENIKEFAKIYVGSNKVLFIDEFQYAKNGGKQLKYLYDTYDIKLVISGSSAPELTIHSLQYLVGRVFIEEIFPISFEEFINYKDKKFLPLLEETTIQSNLLIMPLLEEYLKFGGYPQVILEEVEEDKIHRLKQIVNTYILKEIRDILQYKNSFHFEKLMRILSLQDGSIINKSKISSLLGITIPKLNEMLDILEKTYVISQLKPYTNMKVKELIKSSKIYFRDNGFKNYLQDNFKPLNMRLDKGVIYENFILNSLYSIERKVLFYNYKNNSEVDFLVKVPNEQKFIAIEVKSYLESPKVQRGLYSYLEKYAPIKTIIFNETIVGEHRLNNFDFDFKFYSSIFNIRFN